MLKLNVIQQFLRPEKASKTSSYRKWKSGIQQLK